MRQVSTSLNLYGMVWFLVSMPYFEGELTLERKQKQHIRPYAAALKPYDVTDWSYDESGDLNWVIIRTFKRYDDDPFSPAIIAERFILYTKDFVRIYEKGGDVPIMEYPNTLGSELPPEWGLSPKNLTKTAVGKHIFTHIEWHMTAFAGEVSSPDLPAGWVWADRAALRDQYAVPNAFRFVEESVERRLGYF